MLKPKFGRSWVTLALLLGTVALAVGACSKEEVNDGSGDATGGKGSGATNTAKGSNNSTAATGGKGNSGSQSSTPTGTTASGGGSSSSNTGGSGNVPACQGILTTEDKVGDQTAGSCDGQSVESEAIPTDMIILMDKSKSNLYAIGTDNATPAETGTLSRWAVLTAGMQALATSPEAADIGASITFFSVDGTEAEQCDYENYVDPVVAFGPLSVTGPQMVTAMNGLKVGGLTPTEPALRGAHLYAMQLKAADPTREKVVVLISDGYPTLCAKQLPTDIAAAIAEAASAKDFPIRTFIVGIGDPDTVSGARFNLTNYAKSGRSGSPILIDETQDADGVKKQIVDALLNISNKPLACEYPLVPPSNQVIDVDKMTVTFQPASGSLQELPRVAGVTDCAKSAQGGFYFDSLTNPKKVTVCPCNCAAFGAGHVSLVYGCKPILTIQ